MIESLKQAKGAFLGWRADRAKARCLSRPSESLIDPEDFAASLKNPSAYYIRTFQDFHRELPPPLRVHRSYFQEESRGFGEDAFHTMWWRLLRRFNPESFLEIGVYRGQVLSLVSLISKLEGTACEVTGISPFSPAGDSVSTYLSNMDYLEDTLRNFQHFGLQKPNLIKAFSTDAIALKAIREGKWDMIYIDGNHDYDVVVSDWNACSRALNNGGVIVMDDAGLTTGYEPPRFATGGHPGPSKFASEIDSSSFEEILQVGHNRVFRKR